jgi:hypothetical protein
VGGALQLSGTLLAALTALASPAYSIPEKRAPAMETPTAKQLSARMAEAPALVFARSTEDLAVKTAFVKRFYDIGNSKGRWDVDLEAGWIRFTGAKVIATAPVQVIGTYNTKDGTFLWGWDHPSVPAPVGKTARTMKAYGERNGLKSFTTRKITCSEADAWHFAAVASYLTGAQGAYRGPSGTTLVFMTFGTVELGSTS